MAAFTVRRYRPGDVISLVRLWQDCFGDSTEYIGRFFDLLPHVGTGFTAQCGGETVGMAFAINALELISGGERHSCNYIYAVAVDKRYRGMGIGGALTEAAADAFDCDVICTLPAEKKLYDWYDWLIGVGCALYRQKTELVPGGELPVSPVEAEIYAALREQLLCGKDHLCLKPRAAELLGVMCRAYGGDLYSVGGALVAAYMEGGVCTVREALGTVSVSAEAAAAAVGRALGAKKVELWQSAAEGEPFIAAAEGLIPADTVWNIAFD